MSLDRGYGHDGGHDDSPSGTLFEWHGHDEVVMILQDMVMMLTIQYMSSMIRMRERMKVVWMLGGGAITAIITLTQQCSH